MVVGVGKLLDFTHNPSGRTSGKPFKWIIIDSLIIASLTFLASLPHNALPTINELYISLRAFFYAFLLQIAIERGLKPYRYRRRFSR